MVKGWQRTRGHQLERGTLEGNDLMTKGRWGMVNEHLKTKERDARNSKDNRKQGEW